MISVLEKVRAPSRNMFCEGLVGGSWDRARVVAGSLVATALSTSHPEVVDGQYHPDESDRSQYHGGSRPS